ncbi:MAG TPA: hypothetical protein PLY93_13835, partial [Turneriella sp.]|nr:hypothetical protein [Turneriella sp.]
PTQSESARPPAAKTPTLAENNETAVTQVRRQGSMRVDLAKIEDLVNLIGELIINKNQVDALSNTLVAAHEKNQTDDKAQIADFHSAKNQLS